MLLLSLDWSVNQLKILTGKTVLLSCTFISPIDIPSKWEVCHWEWAADDMLCCLHPAPYCTTEADVSMHWTFKNRCCLLCFKVRSKISFFVWMLSVSVWKYYDQDVYSVVHRGDWLQLLNTSLTGGVCSWMACCSGSDVVLFGFMCDSWGHSWLMIESCWYHGGMFGFWWCDDLWVEYFSPWWVPLCVWVCDLCRQECVYLSLYLSFVLLI